MVSGISPNGRFRLDARPCNEQRFHFRFWDRVQARYRWERTQLAGEPYPEEFLLSDEGYSVVRQHSPLESPAILILSKTGQELLHIYVGSGNDGRIWWETADLRWTSRGEMWSGGSWPYFFPYQGAAHFAWRSKSGQHLVVRLDPQPALVTPDSRLADCLREREISDLPSCLQLEHPKLANAMVLALAHLPPGVVPVVREIEMAHIEAGMLNVTRSCRVLPRDGQLRFSTNRLLARQILRRLNQHPTDLPAYELQIKGRPMQFLGTGPERGEKLLGLTVLQGGREVLEMVGIPDFIDSSVDGDEVWEYDYVSPKGLWTTSFLGWDLKASPPYLAALDQGPPAWAEREAQLMEYCLS